MAIPSSGNQSVTVFYWAKDVGHIAVLLGNGTYVSHVPDSKGSKTRMGTRTDVPNFSGTLIVNRCQTLRFRTLAEDKVMFGGEGESLKLPAKFIAFNIEQAARGWLLASAPDEPPLHGPLPYYQLADWQKGAGDRQQCASTTARILAAGLTLESQDIIKKILAHFAPGPLFAYLKTLA